MRKRLVAIMTLLLMISACADDTKNEIVAPETSEVVQDSIKTIQGEFLYLSDAAVIKGKNFIYGVQLDSLAMDLAKKIALLKDDDFDLVPVTVRAKIIPNPGKAGWDEFVEIREIIEVPQTTAKEVKDPNEKLTDNK